MQVKHLTVPGKFCLIKDGRTGHDDDDAKLEMRTGTASVLLMTIYTYTQRLAHCQYSVCYICRMRE